MKREWRQTGIWSEWEPKNQNGSNENNVANRSWSNRERGKWQWNRSEKSLRLFGAELMLKPTNAWRVINLVSNVMYRTAKESMMHTPVMLRLTKYVITLHWWFDGETQKSPNILYNEFLSFMIMTTFCVKPKAYGPIFPWGSSGLRAPKYSLLENLIELGWERPLNLQKSLRVSISFRDTRTKFFVEIFLNFFLK